MSKPTDARSQVQVAGGTDFGYQNEGPASSAYYNKTKIVSYKDSISHPINVSWIIPPWIDALLQEDMSVPNNMYLIPFAQREAETMHRLDGAEDAVGRAKKIYPNWRPRGNLGLSSCPGKKVRLDGPVNGRATIVRDLDLDFDRLQKLGFTRVVCCLFDEELELLGSPFPKYLEAASSHGFDVVRIPMVEGSTPYSFEEMDRVLDKMDETTRKGQSVLAHCRGGVGRAAVVACCWLLRLRYFKDHREVIEWVRAQRSPKAIETKEQAQFVAGFHLWSLGGESRVASKVYEVEIQRRIDWGEASVAQARLEAAANNDRGHHLSLSQSCQP
ncbi:MAG: protein-tyrosine phosphatase-like protein [Benniella sp.]|nr:MAG: protein-tyrosine phosphatase-like protein [Benniella sp.]